MNKKTICGIDLEAVRKKHPIPHWRVKVSETGYVFESGVFNSESRPKMWESVERTLKVIGPERFRRDILEAA